MTWTEFWDVHSGGYLKVEPYHFIYIEADLETAKRLFLEGFGRDPEHVSCRCCGPDYSLTESETLAEASWFQRNCDMTDDGEVLEQPGTGWRPYQTLEEFRLREDVLILDASQLPKLKSPSLFSAL